MQLIRNKILPIGVFMLFFFSFDKSDYWICIFNFLFNIWEIVESTLNSHMNTIFWSWFEACCYKSLNIISKNYIHLSIYSICLVLKFAHKHTAHTMSLEEYFFHDFIWKICIYMEREYIVELWCVLASSTTTKSNKS